MQRTHVLVKQYRFHARTGGIQSRRHTRRAAADYNNIRHGSTLFSHDENSSLFKHCLSIRPFIDLWNEGLDAVMHLLVCNFIVTQLNKMLLLIITNTKANT
jgi:hypothetical protein